MHQKYLQRCLEIAQKGIGNAAPNPLVGSVIVHQDRIIGEGYHQKYGDHHAEVNAIHSVKEADFPLLKESTLYVNLEPCAHFGQTPPCANLIVKHQIPKVVIACQDPFEKVAGKGIKILEDAGIDVDCGILEKEAQELNKRFITFFTKNRPYIILKWAQTKDGFFAKKDGEQHWISNAQAKRLSHKWRTEEQAIMVGTKTAKIDNPNLTARLWKGKNPLRIVLDRNLTLDPQLNLFNGDANTLIFTERPTSISNQRQITFNAQLLDGILAELVKQKIQSVIIEGGQQLLLSFLNKNLWDEARIFTGNVYFRQGIDAPTLPITPYDQTNIGDNLLTYYRNTT